MFMGYIATRWQAVPKAPQATSDRPCRILDSALMIHENPLQSQPANRRKARESRTGGNRPKKNSPSAEQNGTTRRARLGTERPPRTAPSHAETNTRGRERKEERKDGTKSADQRPN